jgi:hypothetical protein
MKTHNFKHWDEKNRAGIEVIIHSEDTPDSDLFSSLVDQVRGKFPGLKAEPNEESSLETKDPNDMNQREFEKWRQMPKRQQEEPEDRDLPFGDKVQDIAQKVYQTARDEEEMKQKERRLGTGIFSSVPRKRLKHR